MPQDEDDDRDAPTADDAKVDQILAGMKGTNMPDILKANAASSHGEKFAAYQGQTALKKGTDTQKVEPAVVIDQTQQDSISVSEVQKAAAERRAQIGREATTSIIEVGAIPKKSNVVPIATFVVVFAVGLAIVVAKMSSGPTEGDAIPPASAAAISTSHANDPQIPPVPTALTTTTEATPIATNVAPMSTQASPNGVANAGNATSSPSTHALPTADTATVHPTPTATSSSDNDPDRALFKTNRTP
ncbi:MAG TPA: hypothetical protein VF407_01185 [Polyangiaceae bacterium]